ncbi:MAG: helix-turn-helix domain-containing protein [Bacillus sp. (in: Bacteria)]|nr:helix-turn-helix domain-containing protein [Bacillus sp. (in: firmicutes)]
MKKWLTIIELSEKTNIAESTVRRYIQKFPDFFISKGGSRSKRYEDTAIKILVRIKNLFDSGYESDMVDSTLRSEFAMVVDGGNKEDRESTSTPRQDTARDILEIKHALKEQAEALKQQQEFNKLLVEKLKEKEERDKEYYKRFDETIRRVREEKQAILQIAVAQEQEKKKGFLARLFGKQNS